MESCKCETAAKGGWTQQEDRLLLSAAQSARQDGRALRSVFEEVAAQTGRKPNSIRNYYYERIKQGDVEGELCRSAAFVPFERDEVRAMLRTILAQRAKGISVRSCTLAMGNGDTRSMLRYQNKYRSVIKKDPALVREVMAELTSEGIAAFDPYVQPPGPRGGAGVLQRAGGACGIIQKADAVTHNMRIGLNPYRVRPLFFMYSFSGAVIVSLCMNLKKRSGTL